MDEGRSSTRSRLIDVAERLFAERGIDAVSLRTVGAEAGQRNKSAAQYHFGSRQGLLDAIVAARSAPVDAHRTALLAQACEAADPPDLRSLVTLLVQPLAESIGTGGGSAYYLRFLAQAADEPSVRAAWRDTYATPTTVRAVHDGIRSRLADLPHDVLERRLEWSALVTVRLLAEHERRHHAGETAPGERARTVREVVEMQVALLRCPAV
ncbi:MULTISPECIES: TetR/AcrR family transcriptional regulator [Streptomyces]|uniref:TetR/AcrR family transcriptional regulator n=1 Tax=Streptomyces lienomycini TaxID=284035 RepID=A0ABV9X3W9_9ACTN|nr:MULTISPECIES: TetR/AcrR family transcriptional regulator [Streptomyces]